MLRNGRFPRTIHAIIEYLAGALLILAPFLFGFDGGPTAVSIVAGVVVLAVAATTDWSLAVMRAIPIPFHLALDFALAALLVAAPFIFGFTDQGGATAFFIALGVAHLLITLGTRFEHEHAPAAATAASGAPAGERLDRDDEAAAAEEHQAVGRLPAP